MNKQTVLAMIEYLRKRNMGFCFDIDGKLWDIETLENLLLGF